MHFLVFSSTLLRSDPSSDNGRRQVYLMFVVFDLIVGPNFEGFVDFY